MKRSTSSFALVPLMVAAFAGVTARVPAQPVAADQLVRWHFLGTDRVLAPTNAARQKAIWQLPETVAFRTSVLNKLAAAPFGGTNRASAASTNSARLLRPLLDDLLQYETALDWRGAPGQPRDFALAVRLPEARAAIWQSNLSPLLKGWTDADPAVVSEEGIKGGANARAAAGRVGEWFVVGWSVTGRSAALDQFLTGLRANRRPIAPLAGGEWMSADLQLPALRRWLTPLAAYQGLPLVRASYSHRGEEIRTLLKLHFPGGHGWTPQPWKVPFGIIREPLVSFSAIQGLDQLLRPAGWAKASGLGAFVRQATFWAQNRDPVRLSFAVPLDEPASNVIRRLGPQLQQYLARLGGNAAATNFVVKTNGLLIEWPRLPFLQPLLAGARVEGQSYLLGRLAGTVGSNLPPAELFQELKQTNLVYYNWELTGHRLVSWRHLLNVAEPLFVRQRSDPLVAGDVWIRTVNKRLGPAVTQITATSPSEMQLVRNSTVGFTGLELNLIERWLDFSPLSEFNVFLPPPPPMPASLREKLPARTNKNTVIMTPPPSTRPPANRAPVKAVPPQTPPK